MTSPDQDIESRKEKALTHCRKQIDWYEKHKLQQRISYMLLEGSIIVSGLLTPLLILLTDMKIIPVVTSVVTLTAVILLGIFQPKEHYLRFAHTSEILKDHLVKFETRTTERYDINLDMQQALDHFVDTVSILTTTEVSAWHAQMQ